MQDSAACGSGSFAFTWHPKAGFRSFLIHITVRNLLGLNQARENNLVLVENIALCFFDVNMAGGRQIARRTLRLSVPRCGNVMGWSCSSWGAKPQDTGRLLFSEVRRSLGTPCLDIVWINLESFLHMYNIYIIIYFLANLGWKEHPQNERIACKAFTVLVATKNKCSVGERNQAPPKNDTGTENKVATM